MPVSKKGARPERCPICGKPGSDDTKPFCSTRCADVDLQRWFSGAYAIPVAEDESAPEEEETRHRNQE